MVPLGSIQHPMGQNPSEKHVSKIMLHIIGNINLSVYNEISESYNFNIVPQVLSQNAQVIKEELIGYVNALLERMDRADILKKVESF